MRAFLFAVATAFCLTASAGWNAPLPCMNDRLEHGGGLNGCGCHFNRKTGDCHCHQPRGCGCPCQPTGCK